MTSVFIDGAAGTTGLEIRERLADRADLSVIELDNALRKDERARREALNDADIVILCLPDDAAREAAAAIENPRVKVIDASSAHRTAEHWAYGFAEMGRDRRDLLAAAQLVSNPGCYPTGFLALVRPLVRAGLIAPDYPFTVSAASGYSGGGKALIARFEREPTAHRAYALALGHKHVPEMRFHAGLEHAPVFTPSVANTHRGMIVEVPLHLRLTNATIEVIRDTLAEAYAGEPLIALGGEDEEELLIERLAGTDRMALFVFGDQEQARLIAVLDNLGKGAAGAAVQNLNIMAGVDELAGLRL